MDLDILTNAQSRKFNAQQRLSNLDQQILKLQMQREFEKGQLEMARDLMEIIIQSRKNPQVI